METSTKNDRVNEALFAAIDVGSNAIRLGIATLDGEGKPHLIHRHRETVRLGRDAFTTGCFSEATMCLTVGAFRQFRRLLEQHRVGRLRAVATSAMRDARNGQQLIERIRAETGIEIECISGDEEARLVHRSIANRIDIAGIEALCIDIGGGSVEITLCADGEPVAAQSLKLGTVRLLGMLNDSNAFPRLLREYLDGARRKLRELIAGHRPMLCIGTGGNASALGVLGRKQLGTSSAKRLSLDALGQLLTLLAGMSVQERIRKLDLRPDRADVILPAAMIFHEMMCLARCRTLELPDASLLDGVLIEMSTQPELGLIAQQRMLRAWAHGLKDKYHVDERHAACVARLALQLFDALAPLHGLSPRMRLLLEVAALIHEIGIYVSASGHHRHAAYVIMATPMLALSASEKRLLAQIVRYHRKASPSTEHEPFRKLSTKKQAIVWQLSAILRLSIALNKERRDRVRHIAVHIDKKRIDLRLSGEGELLLERWAAMRQRDYFHKAFGKQLVVSLEDSARRPTPATTPAAR
ncbi:MAG: Ppx/GppA family phosphatase [Zetaproteobacteria bacterium]|nr:MAG: Ppx/GppA family phosphatase [Zetaproteobacteria bacterium]